MSIYSIIVNCTHHNSRHITKEEGIDKKENYSCISCWKDAKFNKGTNVARFWKFYQTVFDLAYQANLVIRQAFIQLVSTVTKKTPTSNDEKRLLLKLIKSIYYYYSSKKSVAETAWIIWIIITKIRGFVAGSTLHIIFVNLKKEEKKDRTSTSIFGSFIKKLGKGKGY